MSIARVDLRTRKGPAVYPPTPGAAPEAAAGAGRYAAPPCDASTFSTFSAGLLLALVGCGESNTSLRPSAASTAPGSASQLEEALRLPDPYARAEALGALLPKLDAGAVPEVKETLSNFRVELGPPEFDLLLRFWANQNPEEAMTWTLTRCPVLYRTNAARTAIEILARSDPAKAVAASQSASIDSDDIARVTQIALVQGWFARDRTELLRVHPGIGHGSPAPASALCVPSLVDQRRRERGRDPLGRVGSGGRQGLQAVGLPADDRRSLVGRLPFRRALLRQPLRWALRERASRGADPRAAQPRREWWRRRRMGCAGAGGER